MRLTREFVYRQAALDYISDTMHTAALNVPPCGLAVWIEEHDDNYVVEVEFYEIENEATEVEDGQQGGEGCEARIGEPHGESGCEAGSCEHDDAVRDGGDA